MSQPEAGDAPRFVLGRACCPICRRRHREVTLGFIVGGLGLFVLGRRPKRSELDRPTNEPFLVDWDSRSPVLHAPIWPGSTRAPEWLALTSGPVTCRYGHKLGVPPVAELDRLLERDLDVVYLPAAKV